MTARIDHYAAMLDALEVAKNAMSNEFAATKIAEAQAHATAYAAEQARIGNLIAYVAKWADDEVLDVDAEIREGLGLA